MDNNPLNFHVDNDFNAGNTLRFSKICSGDWYWPGTSGVKPDGSYAQYCDNIPRYLCTWWSLDTVLQYAVPSQNGYVTVLNCPICGCTPGENDAKTMDELAGN